MPRYVNPQPRYVDKNGKALAGGKLNFYSAGTVTRRDTYNSESFAVPNTNPVILDAFGRPQVDIFLDGVYKVVLTDANDQVIWEKDPVGGTTGVTAFSDWIDDATYSVGDIVTGSDGLYYRSLTNGNIGLDPTEESGDWERVQFVREWRTGLVYQTDDVVIGSDNVIYQSLTDENQGNDPIDDQVNWSSVKDYFGVANGVATLDSDGLVPSSQIPPIAITDVYVVADQAARLALDAQVGDIAVQNDNNTAYILQSLPASTNSNWIEFGIQNFGSAAFRDVGTLAGNLMEVGAGGLLGDAIAIPNDDADDISVTAFYQVNGDSTANIPINESGAILHIQRAARPIQVYWSYLSSRSFYRRFDAIGWRNWVEFYHSGNQLALGTTQSSAQAAIDVYSTSYIDSNYFDTSESDGRYLNAADNGSDIPNASAFRNNLELGSAATKDVEDNKYETSQDLARSDFVTFHSLANDGNYRPSGSSQNIDDVPFGDNGLWSTANNGTFPASGFIYAKKQKTYVDSSGFQFAINYDNSPVKAQAPRVWYRLFSNENSAEPSDWVEFWNSANQLDIGTTQSSAQTAIDVYSRSYIDNNYFDTSESDGRYLNAADNLSDLTNYQDARDTLNIFEKGEYGIGGNSASIVGGDFNNLSGNGSGLFIWDSGDSNEPNSEAGVVLHADRSSRPIQQAWSYTTDEVFYRRFNGAGWQAWKKFALEQTGVNFTSVNCPDYDGSSDERLKRCINENVLSKKELSMLVPKMWVWANIDDVNDNIKGRADAGAIAQDLLKIPRLRPLIKKDENGYYKFDRGKIALIIAQSMAYHQYGKGSLWQRIKGFLF